MRIWLLILIWTQLDTCQALSYSYKWVDFPAPNTDKIIVNLSVLQVQPNFTLVAYEAQGIIYYKFLDLKFNTSTNLVNISNVNTTQTNITNFTPATNASNTSGYIVSGSTFDANWVNESMIAVGKYPSITYNPTSNTLLVSFFNNRFTFQYSTSLGRQWFPNKDGYVDKDLTYPPVFAQFVNNYFVVIGIHDDHLHYYWPTDVSGTFSSKYTKVDGVTAAIAVNSDKYFGLVLAPGSGTAHTGRLIDDWNLAAPLPLVPPPPPGSLIITSTANETIKPVVWWDGKNMLWQAIWASGTALVVGTFSLEGVLKNYATLVNNSVLIYDFRVAFNGGQYGLVFAACGKRKCFVNAMLSTETSYTQISITECPMVSITITSFYNSWLLCWTSACSFSNSTRCSVYSYSANNPICTDGDVWNQFFVCMNGTFIANGTIALNNSQIWDKPFIVRGDIIVTDKLTILSNGVIEGSVILTSTSTLSVGDVSVNIGKCLDMNGTLIVNTSFTDFDLNQHAIDAFLTNCSYGTFINIFQKKDSECEVQSTTIDSSMNKVRILIALQNICSKEPTYSEGGLQVATIILFSTIPPVCVLLVVGLLCSPLRKKIFPHRDAPVEYYSKTNSLTNTPSYG